MTRTYLYGIVDKPHEVDLDIAGPEGTSSVSIVGYTGIGCVVSGYQGDEPWSLSKEKLVRALLRHQQVVERVMQEHTILPVKFGTLLQSPEAPLSLLVQGRSQFADALRFIQNKVEIEVAATWDTRQVLKEIADQKEVIRVKESIAGSGHPTFEQRVQMGQMVKAFVDKRREGYRERMTGFLSPLALDLVGNALLSDEMVMNVAFLVELPKLDEFEAAVHRLDEIFQSEITYRMIGPLPPYSFSTVEVTRLTQEQINEALQALDLKDIASEADIRKAYRHMAAEAQRHPKPGDDPALGQVIRLRQASQVLLQYWRARSQGGDGPGGRDKDGLFSVAIKRSEGIEVDPARFGGAVRY